MGRHRLDEIRQRLETLRIELQGATLFAPESS